MKKHYKFEIDCANCAAKVEEAIKKIDGVHGASVSFMTQKLTLDADDARYDEILQQGITTAKLDGFCQIFHCRVEDLITYVEPADGEPHSPYSEKSPK